MRLAAAISMKTTNTKPVLSIFLPPQALTSLVDASEGAGAALTTYMKIAPWPPRDWGGSERDARLAEDTAAALDGVVHSSDTDTEYLPCVLHGVDMKGPDLFAALGINEADRCEVGGYDNPKLSVTIASKKHPPMRLMTNLTDDFAWGKLNEYVEADDQEAYGKAAKALQAASSTIVGLCLCADDGDLKLVFTLAESNSGAWIGVVAVVIET